MKKHVFGVLSLLLSANLASAHTESEVTEAKEDLKASLSMASLQFTRGAVECLAQGSGRFNFKPLCALLMPGAILFDVGAAALSTIAVPAMATRLAYKAAADKIGDMRCREDLSDQTKRVLGSLKKRMEQAQQLVGDRTIATSTDMIALALAFTAVESMKTNDGYLKLADGSYLKKDLLKKQPDLPKDAVALFQSIRYAADNMKSMKIGEKKVLEKVANQLTNSGSTDSSFEMREVIVSLKKAAKLVEGMRQNLGGENG